MSETPEWLQSGLDWLTDWLLAAANNPVWALFFGMCLSIVVWGFQTRLAARLQFKREFREACASFLKLNAKLAVACTHGTDHEYRSAFEDSCASADVLAMLSREPLSSTVLKFRVLSAQLRWSSTEGSDIQLERARSEWKLTHLELVKQMRDSMSSIKIP